MLVHLKANEQRIEAFKVVHDGRLGFTVVIERDGLVIRAKALGIDANPRQTTVVHTDDIEVEVVT